VNRVSLVVYDRSRPCGRGHGDGSDLRLRKDHAGDRRAWPTNRFGITGVRPLNPSIRSGHGSRRKHAVSNHLLYGEQPANQITTLTIRHRFNYGGFKRALRL